MLFSCFRAIPLCSGGVGTDDGFVPVLCSNLSWNTTDDSLRSVSVISEAQPSGLCIFSLTKHNIGFQRVWKCS